MNRNLVVLTFRRLLLKSPEPLARVPSRLWFLRASATDRDEGDLRQAPLATHSPRQRGRRRWGGAQPTSRDGGGGGGEEREEGEPREEEEGVVVVVEK